MPRGSMADRTGGKKKKKKQGSCKSDVSRTVLAASLMNQLTDM